MEAEIVESAISPAASVPARNVHLGLVVCALMCLLILVLLLSIGIGAVKVPINLLLGSLFGGHSLSPNEKVILFQIRLPRTLAAGLVGAALSVAGLLFQGLFRNPLADPYVIGSSGGAVLGGSIGMFILPQFSWFGFSATAVLAFAGSATTIGLVYWLARVGGRTPIVNLLLAGFAVSTMLSYSSYFVEILGEDYGVGMRALASWLHGVIGVPSWTQLLVIAVMICLAGLFALPLARRLNTLALGEDYAHQLGVRVEYARIGVIVVGSLLTAAAVSVGGLISFVGLVVPHLGRMMMGPDNVRLLPVTALLGAILLMLTDTLARTLLAPSELPVGVLMAFIGGPFFLYLLRKTKREYSL